jgi:hypothetical protein
MNEKSEALVTKPFDAAGMVVGLRGKEGLR